MKKSLIAYFSASGVTKALAEKISQAAGGDLFEIKPQKPYTKSDLNWMNPLSRSSKEMRNKKSRPPMEGAPDTAAYDVIFVGFPVWWYRQPSIIDTFMESADFNGKTVVPFCTSGSSGPGKSAENIQNLAKGAKVCECKRFASNATSQELKTWAEQYL